MLTTCILLDLGLSLGQIMPYCSMASPDPHNQSMKPTLDADYWPYEWPIVRPRALRNGHYFFYFVDLVTLVSVSTVVQFASNTLRAVYDEEYNFLGYLPNRGMIYNYFCFASFTIITTATLVCCGGGERLVCWRRRGRLLCIWLCCRNLISATITAG